MNEQGVNARAVNQQQAISLRPRKGLFILLCVVMALWIAALVTMYFTTVWPQRHSTTPLPHENDVDDHRPATIRG